jgi:hypothetical protein
MRKAVRTARARRLAWIEWFWHTAERWRPPPLPAASGYEEAMRYDNGREWPGPPDLTDGEWAEVRHALTDFAGLEDRDLSDEAARAVCKALHWLTWAVEEEIQQATPTARDARRRSGQLRWLDRCALPLPMPNEFHGAPPTYVVAVDERGVPHGFVQFDAASRTFQAVAAFILEHWKAPRRCAREECGKRFFSLGRGRWCSEACGSNVRVARRRRRQGPKRPERRPTPVTRSAPRAPVGGV